MKEMSIITQLIVYTIYEVLGVALHKHVMEARQTCGCVAYKQTVIPNTDRKERWVAPLNCHNIILPLPILWSMQH